MVLEKSSLFDSFRTSDLAKKMYDRYVKKQDKLNSNQGKNKQLV